MPKLQEVVSGECDKCHHQALLYVVRAMRVMTGEKFLARVCYECRGLLRLKLHSKP